MQQFLISKETNTYIPLKQVHFQVEMQQGFADVTLHQHYTNDADHALETLFMLPKADTFILSKIIVEFTLQDGSIEHLETKVMEREQAQYRYDDAVASGQSAVMSY